MIKTLTIIIKNRIKGKEKDKNLRIQKKITQAIITRIMNIILWKKNIRNLLSTNKVKIKRLIGSKKMTNLIKKYSKKIAKLSDDIKAIDFIFILFLFNLFY